MYYLALTLDGLADNLSLDEALLNATEAGEIDADVLRLWEPSTYGVVLGRSSDAAVEVRLAACDQNDVPVLRRSSGGGTVLTGPGCLMYSLVLSIDAQPELRAIDQAHQWVLQRMSQMLSCGNTKIARAGTSDLAVVGQHAQCLQKFSGNAMRVKRDHILYHGTLLYNFDLARIEQFLATPTRTPGYRQQREHLEFVTNLRTSKSALTRALIEGWRADRALPHWPMQRTAAVRQTKYSGDPKWVI